MKRFSVVLVLAMCPTIGFAQRSIINGFCSANNPNNSTSQLASFMVGLGTVTLGSPQCLVQQPPNAPELGLPLPTQGSLKNLGVALSYREVGDGSPVPVTVQVWVNGSPTALQCTATVSSGSGTPTIVKCSDATHEIFVSAGDLVAVEISVPSSITYCSGGPCPLISADAALERKQP
jgi:hypothetical protein